jgi:putative flippase GtrA
MLNWIRNKNIQRWLTFVVGGGINTGFTYFLYLLLKLVLAYQWAYAISYVSGIFFSYWFNSVFVFRSTLSWKGVFAYPLVYVGQYLASAFFLAGLVEYLDVSQNIAPILVAIVLLPITYLLSKLLLGKSSSRRTPR